MNKVYFYATHVYDIIFFVRLKNELINSRSFSGRNICLVINEKLISNQIIKSFISSNFKSILVVPFSYNSSRVIRIKEMLSLKKWFRKNIDRNNKFVLLDKSKVLSRFFIKKCKKVILIQQAEKIDNSYKINIRKTLLDFVKSMITGSKFAIIYSQKNSKNHIFAYKPILFNKKIEIVFNDVNLKENKFGVLPSLKNNSDGKKVIIFGSRFFDWPFIKNKTEFLDKIKNVHKKIYESHKTLDFFYIPHPRESEKEYYYLKDFYDSKIKLVKNFFSSEQFLMQNLDVFYTYSIGSTSSQSAFLMGFKSQVLYKIFNFPKSVENSFDLIFRGLPNEFFSKNLNEIFIEYNLPLQKYDEKLINLIV